MKLDRYPQPQSRRDFFDAIDDVVREHGVDLRRVANTPEVAERTCASLVKRLQNDLLIKQYIAASGGFQGRGARLTEPWMALAEQRASVLILASKQPVHFVGVADEPEMFTRTSLAASLFVSQTFLWKSEIFDTLKTCPLPAHTISNDILPFPFTYHTMEVAYEVMTADPERRNDFADGRYETDWLAMFHTPAGFTVVQHNAEMGCRGHVKYIYGGVRYGTRYPDDLPDWSRRPTGVVLSLLAFLKSPYTEVETRSLPRQWRRGGELSKNDAEKTVSVVTLRRSAREAIAEYESESRAWKHRWWVAGHFRSQWYPSRHAHEVIWIAPHLKGPEGAPMLDKVYSVSR